MNESPFSSAYFCPVSVGTIRAEARSILFPTSVMVMSGIAFSCSSESHFSMFSNEWSFVMSYTTSAPTAPR